MNDSIIRPVLEYCCQLWHSGLTKDQDSKLESVQKRVLKCLFPDSSYPQALELSNLQTLNKRRFELCKSLFGNMKNPHHKLHDMLPPVRSHAYSTRNSPSLPVIRTRTKRYGTSFVPWAISNCQN